MCVLIDLGNMGKDYLEQSEFLKFITGQPYDFIGSACVASISHTMFFLHSSRIFIYFSLRNILSILAHHSILSLVAHRDNDSGCSTLQTNLRASLQQSFASCLS
jgi:hypothetical protein